MFMHDVWVDWHPLLPHGCCYEGWAFGRDSYFMYFKEVDEVSKGASKITTYEWDGKWHGLDCTVWLIDFYVQQTLLLCFKSLSLCMETKNEIESLIVKMEELCNNNWMGKF